MSLLKKVIVTLVVIVLALVAIGWFLPTHYRVERSIVIEAPPSAVYPLVVDLREWPGWGVWFQRDPQLQIAYQGPDRAIGMRAEWSSESQGNGEMEITALEHNHRVAYNLYLPAYETHTQGKFLLEPHSDGTRVIWSNEGEVGSNPLDRYLLLMMDSKIGPDFEMGLQNMKTVVENGR